jgi:hypothetical protein
MKPKIKKTTTVGWLGEEVIPLRALYRPSLVSLRAQVFLKFIDRINSGGA